jgi:hypothetical protein
MQAKGISDENGVKRLARSSSSFWDRPVCNLNTNTSEHAPTLRALQQSGVGPQGLH